MSQQLVDDRAGLGLNTLEVVDTDFSLAIPPTTAAVEVLLGEGAR